MPTPRWTWHWPSTEEPGCSPTATKTMASHRRRMTTSMEHRPGAWPSLDVPGPLTHAYRLEGLQFGLQFNAVRHGAQRTDQARWSSLNRSGRLRSELLMRLGGDTLRGSNPRSSALDLGFRVTARSPGSVLELISAPIWHSLGTALPANYAAMSPEEQVDAELDRLRAAKEAQDVAIAAAATEPDIVDAVIVEG